MNRNILEIQGLIFDIKKYAIHDGPGIRTTVFLKGCPLECWWCHNPEGRSEQPEVVSIRQNGESSAREEKIGRLISVAELMKEVEKDRVFYDQSDGGVTFSGGEPMAQIDFLSAALAACRDAGLSAAVDTCGYAPVEDFEKIYELVDLFLLDLKLADDNLHQKYTGVSNGLILDNLSFLSEKGNKVRLRIPMVPGITDTKENINGILAYILPMKNIRHISLLSYNKLSEDKIRRFGMMDKLGRLEVQDQEMIRETVELFENHGYIVKVGG